MSPFIKAILLTLTIYYLPKFCNAQTDGFALTKIISHHPEDGRWLVAENEIPQLKQICDQRFVYLGAGGQCYAFVSEDGQHVLKLFKHHLRRLHPLLAHLPLKGKLAEKLEQQRIRRLEKLERDYNSYKIAFEELKEECGLIGVHLQSSHHLKTTARIVDRLNIEHQIDLDKIHFILQKRAELPYDYIDHLVEQNKMEEAKEAVDSICNLVTQRCDRGIFDEDAKIHRNFGFVDNQAILIDVGRLKKDERRKSKAVQKQDLLKITHRLGEHLAELSPDLYDHLQEQIEDVL